MQHWGLLFRAQKAGNKKVKSYRTKNMGTVTVLKKIGIHCFPAPHRKTTKKSLCVLRASSEAGGEIHYLNTSIKTITTIA
jgi:hypothetical protein